MAGGGGEEDWRATGHAEAWGAGPRQVGAWGGPLVHCILWACWGSSGSGHLKRD